MTTAGYSKRSLQAKLGIKADFRMMIINPPGNYAEILGPLPESVSLEDRLEGLFDFIHFFTTESSTLAQTFPTLRDALVPNGMLWISWPKKAAKVTTDLSEDVIRALGLENGLVDVKVAAVNQVWSALKFVYRLRDRPGRSTD
jgi:hypothetical protein